mgnify:CR=1 FL=1
MDREAIKQIAYDYTTSKEDAEKLEERILSLFPVSKSTYLVSYWGEICHYYTEVKANSEEEAKHIVLANNDDVKEVVGAFKKKDVC